jgi:putative transposase
MAEGPKNEAYRISDALWEKIEPLLPPVIPGTKGSSARMDDRKAMEAILYIFRTGCDWGSVPSSMGAGSIVYERFREWQKSGLFQRMWKAGLLNYDELEKMVWYGRG